ncbi:MAG: hypothetical protein ACM3JH_13560 [Acidithiobacillales bacterium]
MSFATGPMAAAVPSSLPESHAIRSGAARRGLGLVVLSLLAVGCPGKKEAAAPPSKETTTSAKTVAKGPLVVTNADGSPFVPMKTFIGDGSGKAWEIPVGSVTVKGGKLTVQVGALPGYDSVYDYARIQGANGKSVKVEAEDPGTTGDTYSRTDGSPGHWWLHSFNAFSREQAVLVRKTQGTAPVLTTILNAPDGTYQLFIGSFQGDTSGPFAIGVRWE